MKTVKMAEQVSNFQFLSNDFPGLCQEAQEAEQLVLTSPKASAIIVRSALEKGVNWLYNTDNELTLPYDTRLSSLLHQSSLATELS